MNELLVVRLSLGFALAGILILFVLSRAITIEPTHIYDLCSKNIGSDVRLNGRVASVEDKGKFLLLVIEEKKIARVVLFKGKKSNVSIDRDVVVYGRVDNFNGAREVIAERVS